MYKRLGPAPGTRQTRHRHSLLSLFYKWHGWVGAHARQTITGCTEHCVCTAVFNPRDAVLHLGDEDTGLPQLPGGLHAKVWLCGPHSCLPHCDLYFIRSPAAAVKLTPSRGDGMSSKLTTIFRAFRGKAPGRAADLHSVTRLDINTGIACCLLYTALMEHPPQSLFLLTKSNPKRIFIFTKKGHTWTRVWRWFCRQRSWGRESQAPPGTGSALASGCGARSPAST